MIKIAITGANGRMGQSIVQEALAQSGNFQLVSALVRKDSSLPENTIIPFEEDPAVAFSQADVIIDFTAPQATLQWVETAITLQKPIVIGTTGFSPEENLAIKEAARKIPLLLAPNTSLGIAVMHQLVREATKKLGPDYAIEIIDFHHEFKKDKPSGTALALENTILENGRKSVPIFSIRGGETIGEHEVMFTSAKERLAISHEALDRSLFAEGALKAATWLKDQTPGLYSMQDVLGLS